MEIYLEKFKNTAPQNIQEVIINFLVGTFYNSDDTLKSDIKGNESFWDKECTTFQCGINKYRSFDDLYCCVTTYFPETKPETIMLFLISLELNLKSRKYLIKFSYCSDIRRIRLWFYWVNFSFRLPFYLRENTKLKEFYTQNKPRLENLVHNKSQGNSRWNWEKLFKLANIPIITNEIVTEKNFEELKNFIDKNPTFKYYC